MTSCANYFKSWDKSSLQPTCGHLRADWNLFGFYCKIQVCYFLFPCFKNTTPTSLGLVWNGFRLSWHFTSILLHKHHYKNRFRLERKIFAMLRFSLGVHFLEHWKTHIFRCLAFESAYSEKIQTNCQNPFIKTDPRASA